MGDNRGFRRVKVRAGRDADMQKLLRALAARLADLSGLARGLMIGPPVQRPSGDYGIAFIFERPDGTAHTSFVELGPKPSDVALSMLHAAMRDVFSDVRIFPSMRELADAAVAAWPCAQTLAFRGENAGEFVDIAPYQEH
ncbi:MAG: hypothetical protein F9K29_03415 [Hyphomicrobiaceae bacterium]|nr:MAG: hypothetical protein F9K29_03415 [Hyphomicrobiaceae bacterium]